MGTYVNPGFDNFNSSRKNKFYVDKSMLIALLNEKIGTDDRFLCVSRPRRFGKTMAANMIAAYYSKGCDSHEIFSDLKISKDPSYEENINKYSVIQLDMNDVMKNKGKADLMSFISRRVIEELKEEYNTFPIVLFAELFSPAITVIPSISISACFIFAKLSIINFILKYLLPISFIHLEFSITITIKNHKERFKFLFQLQL